MVVTFFLLLTCVFVRYYGGSYSHAVTMTKLIAREKKKVKGKRKLNWKNDATYNSTGAEGKKKPLHRKLRPLHLYISQSLHLPWCESSWDSFWCYSPGDFLGYPGFRGGGSPAWMSVGGLSFTDQTIIITDPMGSSVRVIALLQILVIR